MEHSEHFDPIMQVVVPYLNFFIFAVAAFFMFRKPILGAISKKRTEFEKLVQESGRLKKEAQANHDQIKAKLQTIDAEMARLAEDLKKQGLTESAASEVAANKLAAHLKEEAKRIAATELEQAKVDLRQELLKAAYEIAQQDLKTRLTSIEQARLIESSVDQLKQIPSQFQGGSK